MAPSTQEANCFLVAQISEVPEKQTGLHKSQMHLSLLSQGPLALPEVSEATKKTPEITWSLWKW